MTDERNPEEPFLPKPTARLPEGVEIAMLVKSWPWEWEEYSAAEARDIRGDTVEFVTLEDGSLIVEDEVGDASLAPLADAIEQQLGRPYRARGVRREGDSWFVAGKHVELVTLVGVGGDDVELSVYDGERTASGGDLSPLDELAARKGFDTFAAQAVRVDGDLFEVELNAL